MVNGLVYSLNTKFINKELDLEVFKDNKSIGKFKIDDFNAEVKNTNGINYFLADNNELFFADTQYIYKYNINDKKVIKNAFTNDIRKFDNIPSNTNNSYIYGNGSTIYEFDKETLTFNSLFQIPSEKSSGLSSHITTYWLNDTFIYVSNSSISFK